MAKKVDTHGKTISRKIIQRSMLISLIGGGAGGIWFMLTAPQQILIIFIKNNLGASSTELGLFLGMLNGASICHLAAIFIYSRVKTIKPYYMTMAFIHRSLSFVTSAAAFYAARGGDRRLSLILIMISSVFTFVLGNSAGSGWWAWMNEIVPPNIRSTYFGKRSAMAQTMNVIAFLSVTLLLDYLPANTFIIFGYIYAAAGVLGILEPFLHLFIPEPASSNARAAKFSASLFLAPFTNRNFRILCLIAGISMMGINISAPFFVPMITNSAQIGAPFIWLGIMFGISQLTWVLLIPFWGTMMDRFGAKPIVRFGMLYPITFIGYIFVTPENYHFVLPAIAFFGGILAPALYEGLNQVMLSLLPQKDRTAYIAWFWALLGSIQALGPIFGGFLLDRGNSIDVLILSSIGVMGMAFLVFDSIKMGKEIKFTHLVQTVTSPGVVKAYFNLPVLARSSDRKRVERSLKGIKSSKGSIALEEISIRLEDADEVVREEAVRALGRIGGDEAAVQLINTLVDEDSPVRIESARALGKMGVEKAVPALVEALKSDDEKLVETAARSLGKIDSPESSTALLSLIRGDRSLAIRTAGAAVFSERKERLGILQEILTMYEQTENSVMLKQLIIAIGNILGKPGEFYQFVTGIQNARDEAMEKLFRDVRRNLRRHRGSKGESITYILSHTLPKALSLIEQEELAGAFHELNVLLLQLIFLHVDKITGNEEGLSEEDLDIIYSEAPRLYAGYMVMRWIRDYREKNKSVPSLPEILLLLYVLKYYRV